MTSLENPVQGLSATDNQASDMNTAYIVDGKSPTSSSVATKQSFDDKGSERRAKRQKVENKLDLPHRPQPKSTVPCDRLISFVLSDTSATNMADGSMSNYPKRIVMPAKSDPENEARALRVLEIMNDFRTVQIHTTSLVTRSDANPPEQSAYYLDGYVVLRQCNAEAQAILATHYNPGNIGLETGRVADTEVQKATLQRIVLDASTRRLQAHKIYLRAAAAMRWVQLRQQVTASNRPPAQKQQAFQAIDQRLQEELNNITDETVMNDLRTADRRKGYWIEEDPSLERMLAWIRRQR